MARIIIQDLLKQNSVLSGKEMDEVQGGHWASKSHLKGYRYRTFYGDKNQKFPVSEYRKKDNEE
ncbi:MAG: hypothetical protein HOC91_18135 [Nitrospinaceae bacterium]|jgi:hypothetical protein|nr:hypothetical protein [Nitrospinaceae bacterium]MBT3434717.1 hypothetical protein [Nitrospinaceae bacterium]MBT3821177.1 hypothetical protein [Nitrospinaceae bacterium]MBT4094997.1 hypothetical protein [Nitrospinaceae bacterium]MBT4432432.1 hypothetical protein [Nitrospinaceae bacterium]